MFSIVTQESQSAFVNCMQQNDKTGASGRRWPALNPRKQLGTVFSFQGFNGFPGIWQQFVQFIGALLGSGVDGL